MKKSILSTAAIVLFLGVSAFAQSMTQYTWDTYKTKFKIGSNMEVVESSGDKFEASNYDINLTIYPEKVSGMTFDKMKSSLKTWTNSNDVVPSSDGYTALDDLNGYWGVMVDGYKGDQQVFLMMIHDPDYDDIAMYVWIAYNQKSYDLALSILKSFTPN